MAAKKPTMAQAYKAATKPKDKGIIGEGKDVLGAMGNQVKQDAQFVAAVGKGAVKGAKAVAGKVANVTVGDVASAPYDFAKNVAKGAGKVAATVGKGITAFNKSNAKDIAESVAASRPKRKAEMPKNPKVKYTGTLKDSIKAVDAAITSKVDGKSPSAGTRSKTAVTRLYANRAKGTPPPTPSPKKPKQNDPGMSKPRGGTPVRKDPGMYKPRGKAPSQSGGRPSKRGL